MDEISPKIPRFADQRKPIKMRESVKVKRTNASGVLTVHEPVQTINLRRDVAKTQISETIAEFKDLSNSK